MKPISKAAGLLSSRGHARMVWTGSLFWTLAVWGSWAWIHWRPSIDTLRQIGVGYPQGYGVAKPWPWR